MQRRLAFLSDELAVLDEVATPAPDEPTHTRIRAAPGSALAEPVVGGASPAWATEAEQAAPVAVVPVPGRHAARRPGRAWVATPGAGGLGPAQVAVVAVVVALGLAVTGWWLLRSDSEALPTAPAATAPALVTPVAEGAGGEGVVAADEPTELVVDVAGRVRRPGIAVLPAGSRVVDALQAAGGARRGVDLSSLNLARLVVDGEQILVGVEGGPAAGAAPGAAPPGPVTLVNLNTAGQSELETLPEVGPVTALAIIAWRDEHGGFASVDQLLDVDGIGEATLDTLGPLVTV